MNLQGKRALVTGASTGIGRAIAVELGKNETFVYLTARNREKLEETAKLIKGFGGESRIILADLSLRDNSLEDLVKSIKDDGKKLDIIANVAGVWHGKDELYADINFEDFKRDVVSDILNVEITATALLTHDLLPIMTNGGSIINISGTFETGAKGWLPYYIGKRAIEDFTVGLADELKTKGIKVNCISPSDTATEEYNKYFPKYAKEAQSPEEIAKFFLKLLGQDVSGKVFVIKNGRVLEGFHK